jgi:hypothetical protein
MQSAVNPVYCLARYSAMSLTDNFKKVRDPLGKITWRNNYLTHCAQLNAIQ